MIGKASRLIICAGERIQPGFITHDVLPLPNIDIQCEFFDLPNYIEDETMSEIHFTHALEHFPMEQTVAVLHTIWKMLMPGGKLYIEVPNLYWNAEELIRNPRSTINVEYIFGGQLNKWDFHYAGFTPELLSDDLKEAGFEISELKPYSSIECMAVKNG